MKYSILITLLVLISACKQKSEIKNRNGIWTESELVELNSIVSEFDRIITSEYKTESKKDAYVKFSNNVIEDGAYPYLKGTEKLIADIKKLEVIDEIWWHYKDYNSNIKPFTLNPIVSYQEYLNDIGKNSNLIKIYHNRIVELGVLGPSAANSFFQNIEILDLNDKNIRLIFAINYLTLINQY